MPANPVWVGARTAARNAVDTVMCSAGGLQRGINDINGKVNPFYSGSRGEAVTRALQKGLESFCPVPPKPPAAIPPEVPGGQCQNVAYNLRYTSNGTIKTVGAGNGPVQARTYRAGAGANMVLGIQVRQTLPSGQFSAWGTVGEFSVNINPAIVGFVRQDGQPDTCGDAPPTPAPPAPPPSDPRPPSNTTNINISPTLSVPVTFAPVVGIVNINADGRVTVPVRVNVNVSLGGGVTNNYDLDFDVDLTDPNAEPEPPAVPPPTTPDGRPDPGDCPPPGGCLPDEKEDEEPDLPPIDPTDPEDKKELEIKAVRVLSVVDTSRSPATEILFSGGGPNIYAPRIGSVKFVYGTDTTAFSWSTDIDVKATDQLIPAPKTGVRCLGAVFSPARGVAGETFFVRGAISGCG